MSKVQDLPALIGEPYDVNAHLHTPYSFSAFDSVKDALTRAEKEGVMVAGINDFYSQEGYQDWSIESFLHMIFPLYNIEFISLQAEDQAANIRVNDPANPGRTYLSGKGMHYGFSLDNPEEIETMQAVQLQLAELCNEANAHTEKMCAKLNEVLDKHASGLALSYADIKDKLTKGNVRERHLAKALRMEVYEKFGTNQAALVQFFEKIFGGKPLQSSIENLAAVENEIRGNLLKSGGAAFIPEDPKAFLPFDKVCKIILDGQGIPTYPFLADDAKGGFTDFERDVAKAAATLKERNIWSVEFIATRNSVEVLERYASYLHDEGFIVTFGSEHNTPAMEPVLLSTRGGKPLTPLLRNIGYAGACVLAAHETLHLNRKTGYLDANGKADLAHRDDFIRLGNEDIKSSYQEERERRKRNKQKRQDK
ncbi:MAG: hypothetical protein LBS94_01445 [Prevotellaceae bacterium]|jgi:hypothetical protein|nr:hypothetical protein [Prevotellaceae bacterium]